METTSFYNVGDIQDDKRRVLEELLGVELNANQQVFIMAFTPGVVPDDATRKAALDNIRTMIASAQQNMQGQSITPDEADTAVDEAMDRIRYGK